MRDVMSTRRLVRLVLAIALLGAVGTAGLGPSGSAQASELPRWTGSMDVYRAGVFTTQKTWLWCTAADVQIARNIVAHQTDHSRASQERYFDWMRAHNRYSIPVTDGVDPQGWAAGLRHFVDGRYRLVVNTGFTAALRSAVTSLRQTGRPAGLLVSHGGHAWLLTGFSATADPARTRSFTVTSVRVVGPLYGLQSRDGYDMPPDTKLSVGELQHYMTPWHYARIRMVWEGRYLTFQAVSAAPAASPSASPRPAPTLAPSPSAAASASPAAGASPAASAFSPRSGPARPSNGPAVAAGPVASPAGPVSAVDDRDGQSPVAVVGSVVDAALGPPGVIVALVIVVLGGGLGLAARKPRGGLRHRAPPRA